MIRGLSQQNLILEAFRKDEKMKNFGEAEL